MKPGVSYDPELKPMLEKAAEAYRRRDDEQFHSLVEQAANRAPQRLDLWFALANHHIQTGKPVLAVSLFHELAQTFSRDVDTLFCLAYWLRFAGNADAAFEARRRLQRIRADRAEDLGRLWNVIDLWQERTVRDEVPVIAPRNNCLAIVTLGYVLKPDGGMEQCLVERLEKTLEAAERNPASIVIVSGGVPRGGRVEATQMRQWLVARGMAEERILEEGYARDLVENLVYSGHIVDMVGAEAALIVTSAENQRRAGAVMETLGWTTGPRWRVAVVAASGDSFRAFRDDGRDRLKLYRDVLRAYGMPMMRIFPELVER